LVWRLDHWQRVILVLVIGYEMALAP
jgi:hypothetical protein